MMNLINEGGNVFKDAQGTPVTRRIRRDEIMSTVEFLEQITGLDLTSEIDKSDGLPKKWLGSTGRKPDSGDLDLAVDATQTSKEQLEKILKDWAQKQGLDPRQNVKKSGASVHFNAPIMGDPANGTVQTDFMFGDPNWMHFSMQGGRQKHILMASIAKHHGLRWSYSNGLSSRMTDQPIPGAQDPIRIAQVLLGPTAKPEDVKSVESIIKKIKNHPEYEQMVADARATLSAEGFYLPESVQFGTSQWFRKLMDDISNEELILNKDRPTVDQIASKHQVSKEYINLQLKKGIAVEFEHTDDRSTAIHIALDHLNEDPDYYIKLKKIESKPKYQK